MHGTDMKLPVAASKANFQVDNLSWFRFLEPSLTRLSPNSVFTL